MSSILIAGLHKSGTTGLYSSIRTAVTDHRDDYLFLYEPKSPDPFLALGRYAPYRPVLAKVLVNRLGDCRLRYGDFDHRFMTVRDPRDIAVSRLLFRPMFGWTSYHIDPQVLEPFVAALKEKEADPASHSVKGLHELADRLGVSSAGWGQLTDQMGEQTRVIDEHGFQVVRYEDFVDGRLEAVSDAIGLPVTNPRAVDQGWTSHIQRSMGYGDWRHWFLDEDVEFFGELFADYAARFGYHDDWERAPEPRIDPATSSEYIATKTMDRILERQARREGKWTVDFVETEEELHQMQSMGADGRAIWAYRSALVLDHGGAFPRDRAAALSWARHAALHAHVPAMALTARFLRESDDQDEATVLEARFWQREHDRLRAEADDAAGPSRADVKRLRRELGRVRDSARYRAGSLLAAAGRDPVGEGPRALRELWRLARRRRRRRRQGSPQ